MVLVDHRRGSQCLLMATSAYFIKLLMLVELLIRSGSNSTIAVALRFGYYDVSCPFAEMIVKNTVDSALQKDPTLSAGLLRMHFHDCFVEGCDGSVLVDSTKDDVAEKDSPANLSLRGFDIIDKAKEEIEITCQGVVSCADILAMAARDSVFWAGGPYYGIPMGRKDGRRSRIEDTISLPPPFLNSTALIKMFGSHGFTVQDMVALSGGHTLGAASCATFKSRLHKFDSTHDVDPSLDSRFAASLSRSCAVGDDKRQPFDRTWTAFDNDYYIRLQSGSGLLTSDETLFTSTETRGLVGAYAANQARFFFDFSAAMVKMGLVGVKEGAEGEVRVNCRKIN